MNKDHTGKHDEKNENIRTLVKTLLHEVGEDIDREGLLDTPDRVARMYREIFSGIDTDPKKHLETTFVQQNNNMVVIKDIPFFSSCEHHLVPFFGVVHVGYVPGPVTEDVEVGVSADGKHVVPVGFMPRTVGYRVAGLSKFARVVDDFARRPQIQEQLTAQIAETIQEALKPSGVIVVVKGQHMCMSMRGVQKQGSWTVTSQVHGIFNENKDGIKDEFLQLLSI